MNRPSPGATEATEPGDGTVPNPDGRRSTKAPERLLDMAEVADWLATTPRHVQRLVTERRIPFVKIGHFVRFDPADVTAWIEGQKTPEVGIAQRYRSGTAQSVGSLHAQSLAPRATGRQAPSPTSQSPAWMRRRAT